jgi:hypothetical protein
MMTSSSSAYGSSFHDSGDGNDNNKNFFTPGKRKSTHDDDDDGDGNDNGTPKDNQEANMIPPASDMAFHVESGLWGLYNRCAVGTRRI